MKVETLEIAGFKAVLECLRLPFKKEVRSNIVEEAKMVFKKRDAPDEKYNSSLKYQCHSNRYLILFDDRDIALMQKLVLNGDEHAKVIRGIIVYAMIEAPRYFWQEMDTYRVGTDRLSSESTMHNEARGLMGRNLQRVKGELKESHLQKRGQLFSYQTLRRIYFQRREHRLPEWHIFNAWILTLPFANELIIVER